MEYVVSNLHNMYLFAHMNALLVPHVRYIIDILKDRDILYPSYITDCIKAKRLLPIGPK